MKCLVTGGAGFIGSNLVDALLDRGDEVRVIDNLSTGSSENIAHAIDRIEFMEATITDENACRQACEGMDKVFHLAAIPSVPRSVDDPLTSHNANATGTLNMLLGARDAGVDFFVYSASSSAYGDTPTLPKLETMPPNPQSPYAAQKYMGELYCENFSRLFGLKTIALRYFNIFGPRQDPNSPYGAVVPKFIKALLSDKKPIVFGDGGQTRDFTYIENAVSANLLAADAPDSASGRVYNIACGSRFSLLNLLDELYEIVGKKIEAEYMEPRAGDVRDSQADISRAGKNLGYNVTVDFREGLEHTVQWHKESGE